MLQSKVSGNVFFFMSLDPVIVESMHGHGEKNRMVRRSLQVSEMMLVCNGWVWICLNKVLTISDGMPLNINERMIGYVKL